MTDQTPRPLPDPVEALARLGAQWSPDLDAYASGMLPAHLVRCLICESAPCECQARGLVFGSAAYFARMDAMHGRAPSAPARTCSAPGCPATARVGEHPAGIAVSGSGGDSFACMVDVKPRAAAEAPAGNCPACWHLWTLHESGVCCGKVYPAHSLTGEPCPCEQAPPAAADDGQR